MPKIEDGLVYDEDGSILLAGYVPTLWASCVSLVLFFALTIIFLINWRRSGKQRYMLWVLIGSVVMVIGFSARISLTYFPTDLEALGPYLIQQIFILLAPCAFIGQIYALIPRLAEWMHREDCLLLPVRKVFWIFVISDLITLNLQSTGASVAGGSQGDKTQRDAGFYITMVGIIAQLISLVVFCVVVAVFGLRVRTNPTPLLGCNSPPGPFRASTPLDHACRYKQPQGWQQLYAAIVWNCAGLLVRTAFRTAEYAEGDTGRVHIVEWYSYAFDIVPVFLSIASWTWVWPPQVVATDVRSSVCSDVPLDPMDRSRAV